MDDEEFELMLMQPFAYELDPDLWDEQEYREDQVKGNKGGD